MVAESPVLQLPGAPEEIEPPGSDVDFVLDATRSPDGEWIAWHEWNDPWLPWQESRIVRRRRSGGDTEVLAGGPQVGVGQPRWSPDGTRIAFVSDAAGWANVWIADADGAGARPLLGEPHEHAKPTWGPGQRTFAWSPDGREIAFNRNEAGFGRLCVAEIATSQVRELGKGWHDLLVWDDRGLHALRSGARTPKEVVRYDASAERTRVEGDDRWYGLELSEPELVAWPADDGTSIPGRLYRPAVVHGGPPPLLAWVHGGPTDQMEVSFHARLAYFVERGWAVLVPDHRGSSGWGRAWEDALHQRWGKVDVEDVASGMRAAAERGWCDPDRMVAFGGSAGGSTTLRLASRHPDLCAAAIARYPVVDLTEPSPSRFEAHSHEWLVGDPWPIETLDRPVLVTHGTADDVVPFSQSVGLRDRFPDLVELHLYEGEGHGGWTAPAIEDELARAEDFLARVVPGSIE
jgi:dipeptidyl aminopeptidase/acylaminoacyl peptidase